MNYVIIWAFRLFEAALLAFGVAYAFHREWTYEQQVALTGCTSRSDGGRYTVIWLTPWALPLMVVLLWLISLPFSGPAAATALVAEFSLQLVVLLTCYFGALLLLLPLLRRKISARACATLWLLPVFLYYYIMFWPKTFVLPLVVLSIPNGLVPVLLGIWLAGAAAVVLWYLVSHLRFRRRLLKDARPVEDTDVINLWWDEHRLALVQPHIRLVTSPAAASPLTIGLFTSTMCTVLPERDYILDQYQLIFRHELRHVQRMDISTKCFYLFCKALCWFNPLMWAAIRKASADLELSCDEMVVYDAEDDTRREYAALLLETAGDERGFTTCLSASASSLRRRLKGVMVPRERSSGALVLGLIMAVLVLCSGLIWVSTANGTAGELLFPNQEEVILQSVNVYVGSDSVDVREPSPAMNRALLAELSDLPVTKLAVGPNISGSAKPRLSAFLSDREHLQYLRLTDGLCSLTILDGIDEVSTLYRVDGPVDWEGLYALVE